MLRFTVLSNFLQAKWLTISTVAITPEKIPPNIVRGENRLRQLISTDCKFISYWACFILQKKTNASRNTTNDLFATIFCSGWAETQLIFTDVLNQSFPVNFST